MPLMPASTRFIRANIELITEDGEVVEYSLDDLHGPGLDAAAEWANVLPSYMNEQPMIITIAKMRQ